MLKNLAIVAMFVLLQVQPLQPQSPAQSNNHAANTQAHQKPEPSTPVVVKVDNHVTCEECSNKDTIAAQDPYKWVRRGFWINFGLTSITLIIAGATWRQASAAKAAVDLSRDITKKQLRAYLCVEEACVIITENDGHKILEGRLDVKNGGQTPAYDVWPWTFGDIRPYPESTPVPRPPGGLPRSRAIIPAQSRPHQIPVKRIQITPQDWQSLNSPNAAYYVQGEVHYRDIFKDWHCLKVRMFFGGPPGMLSSKNADGVILGHLVPDSWGNSEEDEAQPGN